MASSEVQETTDPTTDEGVNVDFVVRRDDCNDPVAGEYLTLTGDC